MTRCAGPSASATPAPRSPYPDQHAHQPTGHRPSLLRGCQPWRPRSTAANNPSPSALTLSGLTCGRPRRRLSRYGCGCADRSQRPPRTTGLSFLPTGDRHPGRVGWSDPAQSGLTRIATLLSKSGQRPAALTTLGNSFAGQPPGTVTPDQGTDSNRRIISGRSQLDTESPSFSGELCYLSPADPPHTCGSAGLAFALCGCSQHQRTTIDIAGQQVSVVPCPREALTRMT